ncbi:BTAD domain-containing putative transcriptional regulator [Kutzneria viridogrisea]|uniref:DNA-binding SARP family transcriptional activator n=1 Tax=Kutzneria viridogrisea TaxID=47990 RepID=A0ABR6B8Q4_9PSEU|nr:DNA-binding SARP family transcriptional activator [Kutzneria viridogrisea]
MDVCVLGPVLALRNGVEVPITGRKPKALVAVLAVNAGRVVSAEALISALWGADPPSDPRARLHSLVSAVRSALGGELVVRRSAGYLLVAEAARVDLQVFAARVASGRSALAEERFQQAAEELLAALELWRGTALLDVDGEWAVAERDRLAETRLAVSEDLADARLALGEGAELVAELTAQVAEHPLRERLRGQLVLALHQAGRKAEALRCYEQIRRLLVEELGIEPGAELRAVHAQVLRGDGPRRVEPRHNAPAPAQLPPDISDFTGREEEITRLAAHLLAEQGTIAVAAVAGKPGSGKSALAIRVCHRVRQHFDGGQFYVNLRGATASPQQPSAVLGRFLHALGVPEDGVPAGLDERAALFRSLLAGRRALVVLDDAADEGQVRPLLPGAAGCAVLITSRRRLGAVAGAVHVDLPVFADTEALALLGALAGPERVAAQPEQAADIVRLCGHLPLAVRITGARLAARPQWPLAELQGRLRAQHRLLNELVLGDLEVRGSLMLSYEGLGELERIALRRLGMLGVTDFAGWLVAALLDLPPQAADEVLERLVDATLLDTATPDGTGAVRYTLHDLTREFCREQAEPEPEAVERCTRYAAALVEFATHHMPRGTAPELTRHLGQPPLGEEVTRRLLTNPTAWLDAEGSVLVGLVERASELGLVTAAATLAATLSSSAFSVRNHFSQWWHTHSAALDAAHRSGDRASEASLLVGLGNLRFEQDRLDEAVDYLDRARTIYRETGDDYGRAVAQLKLCSAQREWGRLRPALSTLDELTPVLSSLGDPQLSARAVHGRAMILTELGRLPAAAQECERAVAAYQDLDDRYGQALAIRSTGIIHRALGELDLAERDCVLARRMMSEIGDQHMLAYATQSLSKVLIRQGRGAQVLDWLTDCLRTCHEVQDGFGQALMLRTLGERELADGRAEAALDYLDRAVQWWSGLDLPLWRARTLRDVASAQALAGDSAAAETTWQEALATFRQYGSREAGEPAGGRVGVRVTG